MHFLLQPIDNQRFLKIIAINGLVQTQVSRIDSLAVLHFVRFSPSFI